LLLHQSAEKRYHSFAAIASVPFSGTQNRRGAVPYFSFLSALFGFLIQTALVHHPRSKLQHYWLSVLPVTAFR
jgi:hypothetical protein